MKAERGALGYCLLGSSRLLEQTERLFQTAKAVEEGKDPEAVHDMRVASRRLRASLAIFGDNYPKRQARAWSREVKGVTQTLSEARDLDVQIQFLQAILKEAPKNARPGVEEALHFKTRKREEMQEEVVSWLGRLNSDDTLEEMQTSLRRAAEKAKAQGADIRTRASYAAAQKHISRRMESLLDYERFVHQPGMWLKHHEMRIAVKKLRYSVEAFSSLFSGELKPEIQKLKSLQDVLGEMHDTDVWIMTMPDLRKLIGEMKVPEERLDPGLDFLLKSREKERLELYKRFVVLWEDLRKDLFFVRLQERIGDALRAHTEELEVRESLQQPVKLALISDIHGNIQALNAVLDDALDQGVVGFLNAGDSVGYGANPKEVLNAVNKKNMASICGNFDLKVLNAALEGKARSKSLKKQVVAYSAERLGKEEISFLQSLPNQLKLEVRGKRLFMVHASPLDDDEHLGPETPDSRLLEIAQAADTDIIVVGHSHVPFSRTVGDVLFINPGSVGRPADHDPRASYAILDTNDFSVSFCRLDYEIQAAIEAINEAGLPPIVGQMTRWGLASSEALEVGKIRPSKRSSSAERMRTIEVMAKSLNVDFQHAQQVRKLAMRLFDQLKPLHGLRQPERFLLEASSLLHDIGWSQGIKKHNQISFQMIMEDRMIPLEKEERLIVACLSRYHRKRPPLDGDEGFKDLRKLDKTRVRMLSSLLRIADGLDYSHQSIVNEVSCEITDDHVVLTCEASGPMDIEKNAAQKKSDLFVETFDRSLVIND